MRRQLLSLTVLFSLTALVAFGQTDTLIDVKTKFALDSLGCSGIRYSCISSKTKKEKNKWTGQKRKRILINGIDLIGQTEDTAKALLGKPNKQTYWAESARGRFMSMEGYFYYLTTCGKTRKGLILYVDITGGTICDIKITSNEFMTNNNIW
jgi:hypothetical protein